MKFAIIQTGGKQYKVAEGDKLAVEKLTGKPKQQVRFNSVMLYHDGKQMQVGKPYVKGASVSASIVGTAKDAKVRVVKFKSKVRYRKVRGHRQTKTTIKIEKISLLK